MITIEDRLREACCDEWCIGHERGCKGCPVEDAIELIRSQQKLLDESDEERFRLDEELTACKTLLTEVFESVLCCIEAECRPDYCKSYPHICNPRALYERVKAFLYSTDGEQTNIEEEHE